MTHHMYIFTMISMGCSNFSYFDIFFGVCGQTYDKIWAKYEQIKPSNAFWRTKEFKIISFRSQSMEFQEKKSKTNAFINLILL